MARTHVLCTSRARCVTRANRLEYFKLDAAFSRVVSKLLSEGGWKFADALSHWARDGI